MLARPRALPQVLVVAPLPVLASLILVSLTSAYPSLSWYVIWECGSLVGIIWLLCVQASYPVGRRNLVAAMGVVVAVVVTAYLVSVAFAWQEWLSLGFPVTSLPLRPLGGGGLLLNPLWMSDTVALCAPVVVVGMWVSKARLGATLLATASTTAIVLAGTRSVLLLVVVVGIVTIAIAMPKRSSRRIGAISWGAAIAVALAGLSVFLLADRQLDEGRLSAYASAVSRFLSAPITGTGPGTYGVGRMSDSVDLLAHLAFPDAHNILLTAAADTGVIGIVGLLLSIACYAVACRKALKTARNTGSVNIAAIAGIAVVAGHAMVEVVFVLGGILLLLMAVVAVAVTDGVTSPVQAAPRNRGLTIVLASCLMVVAVSGVARVGTEVNQEALARADRMVMSSPDEGLAIARDVTMRAPDSVPAWWVRMIAADATGNAEEAIGSARKAADLEGFGQEWLSLGVLELRAGDPSASSAALERSTAHQPIDPIVELNTAAMSKSGDARLDRAARALLTAQADIEPILAQLPDVARAVAGIRAITAEGLVALDPSSAILIALSGNDRALATAITAQVEAMDADPALDWREVVAAWFGDDAARAGLDAKATSAPSYIRVTWAWRLAAENCDPAGADHWARAAEIAYATLPTQPTSLLESSAGQARQFPARYPSAVWRTNEPTRAYVSGIWSYGLGRRDCS